MLSRYLDGECRSSEAAVLEKHLAGCPACAAELQRMRQVNRLLDTWQTEPAPGALLEGVMAAVTREARGAAAAGARPGVNAPPRGKRPAAVLRDLAVAAAVSLALFWSSAAWLPGRPLTAAGQNVNGAVNACAQLAGAAVDQLTETAGKYTSKILFEGKQGAIGGLDHPR